MPFTKSKTQSSKGGKFVATLQRLAKARTKDPKRATMGGPVKFGSKIVKPEGSGVSAKATEGQTALDPEQQGASNKNMQRGKGRSN